MTASRPKFLPFPFAQLRRISRRDAAFESACARWLDGVPRSVGLAALAGGPIRGSLVGVIADPAPGDPHAAVAELRIAGLSILLTGSGLAVRRIAQRLLGGPHELAAPRPLTSAEHAIFALVIATACEDAQIAAEIWPRVLPDELDLAVGTRHLELALDLAGTSLVIHARVPAAIEVRTPPARALAAWTESVALACPIVIGRCALTRGAIAALAPRDIVVIDGLAGRDRQAPYELELAIGRGSVRLRATPGALEARTITGYGYRDMALPDDAHLELTVTLGTTQLSLRQLVELSIGQIVPLGRPLGGPFELRAEGRVIGTGELVDVDGELGVRVLGLGDTPTP